MKISVFLVGALALCLSVSSCNKCETCVQYKVPMDGGELTSIGEEEVCGRKDIIAQGDDIQNDVSFSGDSVLYQTYWECSK